MVEIGNEQNEQNEQTFQSIYELSKSNRLSLLLAFNTMHGLSYEFSDAITSALVICGGSELFFTSLMKSTGFCIGRKLG